MTNSHLIEKTLRRKRRTVRFFFLSILALLLGYSVIGMYLGIAQGKAETFYFHAFTFAVAFAIISKKVWDYS